MISSLGTAKELWIYPIKSCGGISVQTLTVDEWGPRWDRRWLIVDATNGRFLTQRQLPQMATIQTRLSQETLCITIPGTSDHHIQLDSNRSAPNLSTKVWNDDVSLFDEGDDIAAALSSYLKRTVRLGYMDQKHPRIRHKDVSFPMGMADSRPFLVTTTSTLAALNHAAGTDLPMDRFRPNIVVANDEPHLEYEWTTVAIGPIRFREAIDCERCIITTIDQSSGQKKGPEPLKTLKADKRHRGIIFGRRMLHANSGEIKLGDIVTQPD